MRRLLAILFVTLGIALGGCGSHSVSCDPASQKTAVNQLMSSWYLYPDLLVSVDPNDPANPTVQAYLDALTATARSQGMDRGWTYATTTAQQQAFFAQGTAVGFGVSLLGRKDASQALHVFVSQVFGGSPAELAGFKRGDEILAVGDTPTTLVTVQALIAGATPPVTTEADAAGVVAAALGPSTAGLTKSIQVMPRGGTTPADVAVRTVTKSTFSLDPVPQGAVLMPQGTGGPPIGYVALRSFITPAEALLTTAFQQLRTAGVQEVIVDLRYNGGGLVETADVLANLLGGARAPTDVMFSLTNNPMHLDQNETVLWAPQPQSIAPLRVAFITTGATASASELVPNALEPYLAPPGGAPNIALVGAKTYGKPVGQRGFTMQACGTVVYLVSLKIVNSEDEGGYYQGLPDAAGAFAGPLCQAPDDLTHDTWESAEASTAAALSWLATGTCPAPAVAKLSGRAAALALGAPEEDVYPEATEPDLAQRHVRGLF